MAKRGIDPEQPIYVISIAAELAGVHPQTLRIYERKGLVAPQRTAGNSRRYSERDIEVLRRIQALTNEGVNLAGVVRIMEMELELQRLKRRFAKVLDHVELLEDQLQQAMGSANEAALVPFRDIRRIRRAMKADAIDQWSRRRTFPSPPIGGGQL